MLHSTVSLHVYVRSGNRDLAVGHHEEEYTKPVSAALGAVLSSELCPRQVRARVSAGMIGSL